MLPVVPVRSKRVQDYVEAAGEEAVAHLRAVAKPLRGARLLHVSSTPFGGGVAELLHSHVPLLNDLGVETVWMVLEGTDEFHGVTKSMHNALQGAEHRLTDDMQAIYWDRIRAGAAHIRLQILEDVTGSLVDSVSGCAESVTRLLRDPELRERLGVAGHERVRECFLSTRELDDLLRLMSELS